MVETSKMITTAQPSRKRLPAGTPEALRSPAYFFLGTPPVCYTPDPEFIWGNAG
jgi:hypothetical protein